MLLKFQEIYRSINKFPNVEIGNFSILTGKNGSGKTQLLESIINESVQVVGIKKNEIRYYTSASFLVPKEETSSIENLKREKIGLWRNFIAIPKNKQSHKDWFKSLKQSCFSPETNQFLQKISNEKNKPILLLNLEDLENNHDLFQNLEKYRKIIEVLKIPDQCDYRVRELAYNFNGFIDEITQDKFLDKINVNPSEQNFFANQISKIFVNFNLLCAIEYSKLIKQNEDQEITPKTYKEKAVQVVLKNFGGKLPWDYINELFGNFEDFKYKITKPDNFELTDLDEATSKPFTAILQDEETGTEVNFNELSSGEKTLLTTTLMLFNTVLTKHSPKLVLLDEIDSTLHPSMTKDLLTSLQSIFVNNGVNVILVSHSPSTIAFAQMDSIYLVDNTTDQLLKKVDNQTALEILTQGFMTLKDGNVIFDAINNYDLTIFSEGNNANYIQTAIELHLKEKSSKVNVWKGIEDKTSYGQLEMLYHLFNSVNLNKKILIIFDPEVETKAETNAEKQIFVKKLEISGNKYAQRGIESVLPDSAFEGFRIKFENELTGKLNDKFPSQYKTLLCKKITSERNLEIFENFKPLTDLIIDIMDNSSNED